MKQQSIFLSIIRRGFLPPAFYFVFFCIITYPAIKNFSTHFFTDQGDGLQNVWNLWWVNKAAMELGTLPWYTTYLHFPYGTSLLGHTLNPFNGVLAIPLLTFLTLTQVYNTIVVFSFVVGGFTAFLLAYEVSRSYGGSILAGYIFTFSNYHFAHAEGHLQLVSLEWLPLFLLCWYRLLLKPGMPLGIAAAVALFATLLCDYYYFFYASLAAAAMTAWYCMAAGKRSSFQRSHCTAFAAFLGVCMVTVAPLVFAALFANMHDPLQGAHDAQTFSLDLLAPFIPGGHWFFREFTKFYWSQLPGNIHESSVHLGLSVIALLLYVWCRRNVAPSRSLSLWYGILFLFLTLSLGPVLHIRGQAAPFPWLPYTLLERLFPPLRLSGVPVRMMVMVTLSSAVLCAVGWDMLSRRSAYKKSLMSLFCVVLFLEYLPQPIPLSRIPVPPYVGILRTQSDHSGVLDDTGIGPTLALYYQTIHQKPLAFGYISRVPSSVLQKDKALRVVLHSRDYVRLCTTYGLRYFLTTTAQQNKGGLDQHPLLYEGGGVNLYDLGDGRRCVP